MKASKTIFYESLLFQKKIKSLNKNEKILNQRKILSSISNKKKLLNKTENFSYFQKSGNNTPYKSKTSRIDSVSHKMNNNSKFLPQIFPYSQKKLKDKGISTKSHINGSVNYLNLSKNLVIKEEVKYKNNGNIKTNSYKNSINKKTKNNLSFTSRNYRNKFINKKNLYNSISVKILNPEINNSSSNIQKINKLNLIDLQMKKLMDKKDIKNNNVSNNTINNKILQVIPNIILKIKSLKGYINNNFNVEEIYKNLTSKFEFYSLNPKKRTSDILEENKNNKINNNDIYLSIKYIFFENIINNLNRKVKFIDIQSEKEFNQDVLRIIDKEITNSFFKNNIIKDKFSKDFTTYGYEFNPEMILKNKNDILLKDIKENNKNENIKKIQNYNKNKLNKSNIYEKYNNNKKEILKQIILNSKLNNTKVKNFDSIKSEHNNRHNISSIYNKKDDFSQTDRRYLNSLDQSKIDKLILEEFRKILNSQKMDYNILKPSKKIMNRNNFEIKTFFRRSRRLYTINRKLVKLNTSNKKRKNKKFIYTQIYKTLNNTYIEKVLFNQNIGSLSSLSKKYLLSLFFNNSPENENNNSNTNNKSSKLSSSKEIENQSNKEETDLNLNIKPKNSTILNKEETSGKNDSKNNSLKNQNSQKTNQKKKLSQYEIDKIEYEKNKVILENLKLKIEEINEINNKIKEEKNKIKLRTSIFNYNNKYVRKPIIQRESQFMKKLKEEKYRNIIRKLTTQRKVDKSEYNQLKLDLNINNSSEEEEEENEGIDKEDEINGIYNEKSSKSNLSINNDELCENEINFFGVDIKIKQNQREKELYEKFMKLKNMKYLKDLKQRKITDMFKKELKEGIFNEQANEMRNRINKKLFTKRRQGKKKTKRYFKFNRKKYIQSLDEEYHSDDSIQKNNYFLNIDMESKKEIEKRKEEILLNFKNDIIYKIKKAELTFNELSLYDELEKKLKNFENNLSNKNYIELLNKYFNNLYKQLEISEGRKMKEYRINHFMNNLIDDMDFLLEKKKLQENDLFHVLNYKEFNHINKLSNKLSDVNNKVQK